MVTYQEVYKKRDIRGAVRYGFNYLEGMDYIVGHVHTTPYIAKQIVLNVPEDVVFDYVHHGLGMIRTAYFKMVPTLQDNEIRFLDQEKSVRLRLFLI